jgi:6-phosphogluconolactonase (cycloisomerase 2 family)
MKALYRYSWLPALAVLAVFSIGFFGCSSGGDSAPARVPSSQGIVTANTEAGTLSFFDIDNTTGQLSLFKTISVYDNSAPTMVALHPVGAFFYVANSHAVDGNWLGSSAISVYAIDFATETATEITGSPFPAGDTLINIAIDPTGNYLYGADQWNDTVLMFRIDPATGALTPLGLVDAYDTHGIAMHPSGQFLFDGSESSYVRSWVIDPATGGLTPAPNSPYAVEGCYVWLAPTPDGKFLYAAGQDYFAGFAVNGTTGELTLLEGMPMYLDIDVNLKSIAITPDGKYMYAADFYSNVVAGLAIDAVTGGVTLVTEEPFPAGTMPKSVAVDEYGKFVYVANYGSDSISAYRIDAATGVLTAVGTYAAGDGPKFIFALPYD